MGKLYSYQPTLGMAQVDRIEANYAAKILEWLHSVENLLTTVAAITYTDEGCTLTPLAENINGKKISIEVSGTNIDIAYTTGNTSPAWSTFSVSLKDDPLLYIVSDDDVVAVGASGNTAAVALCSGTKYDGTECGVLIGSISSQFEWYIANGPRSDYFSKGNNYSCTNKYSAFCFKPFTCYADGIIVSHVMEVDGGMGLPGIGQIYTVNDETYVQFQQNFALKV